jgi:RNA polymerase sigma-70 factor (ECF subfamily)
MNDFQKEEVFQAFVGENRRLWVRLAYRVLGNREEAEDVVQETLFLLWEKGTLSKVDSPGAYTARSIWLNAIKRKTRGKVHVPLEEAPEAATHMDLDTTGPSPAADPARLEQALLGLPETQRNVIRMKYYMGLSFKEIGEALKISLNTAGSRCRYALRTLRQALEGRKS